MNDKLKKPKHLTEETWRQHLQWMELIGKKADTNSPRHAEHAEEDAKAREEFKENLHL